MPKPVQHRAKPVVLPGLTGFSESKKFAILTQPKELVALDCNCTQSTLAGSRFSSKVERHR